MADVVLVPNTWVRVKRWVPVFPIPKRFKVSVASTLVCKYDRRDMWPTSGEFTGSLTIRLCNGSLYVMSPTQTTCKVENA